MRNDTNFRVITRSYALVLGENFPGDHIYSKIKRIFDQSAKGSVVTKILRTYCYNI